MDYEDIQIRYQAFAKELRELCEKHQTGIVSTCSDEGIYGEITLFPLENPNLCGWTRPKLKTSVIHKGDYDFILG